MAVDTTPIIKRTLFADVDDGPMMIHDWALVGTTSGTMVEPRYRPDFDSPYASYDYRDQIDLINRVDEIKLITRAQRNVFINCGETIELHGEGLGIV